MYHQESWVLTLIWVNVFFFLPHFKIPKDHSFRNSVIFINSLLKTTTKNYHGWNEGEKTNSKLDTLLTVPLGSEEI